MTMVRTVAMGPGGVTESALLPCPSRCAARSRQWRHQRQLRIMRHRSRLQVKGLNALSRASCVGPADFARMCASEWSEAWIIHRVACSACKHQTGLPDACVCVGNKHKHSALLHA